MNLTPLDIEAMRFRGAFRGYARDDVERFRESLVRAVEEYIGEIGRLKTRIGELENDLARYHETEDLLKNSVVLAQRTCDELIAAAHQRASAIEREAQAGGDEIRRRLSELTAEREQFEYAFYGLLSGFMRRLEAGNPQLAGPAAHPPDALPAPRPAQPVDDQPPALILSQPPAVHETLIQSPPRLRQATPSPAAALAGAGEEERDADAAQLSALLAAVQVEPAVAWPPATATPAPEDSSPEAEAQAGPPADG